MKPTTPIDWSTGMSTQTDREILQLGYMRIGVRHLAWWDRFTERVGFDRVSQPDPAEIQLRTDAQSEYRIALSASEQPGVSAVGWEAAGPRAMEAVRLRLQAQGARFVEVTQEEKQSRRVEDMFAVLDPDGLRNEIYWGPNSALRKPFRPRHAVAFQSAHCGNGHVTMNVADAPATLRFYLDGLGFRLSDAAWMEGHSRVYFLRCNPRHHSYAFAQMPSRPVGTVHVMTDIASLDHLGAIRDRLLDDGIELSRDLGSHPLDGVVSLYVASPEGFEFELACGTRLINEATWESDKFTRGGLAWGHRKAGKPGGRS
jgi:3,4-dihydroxy-9,10-secoandrosta-1,3,5(10)-triene-9,17-dione 4,5-dioxygenase